MITINYALYIMNYAFSQNIIVKPKRTLFL